MIFLLTPTGGRLECLEMLAKHIVSQEFDERMVWVVVDDGEFPSVIPSMPGNIHVSRIVLPHMGLENTQARNMWTGLSVIPASATVLVLEDDDVYLPGHFSNLLGALNEHDLVGERTCRYYNIASGRFRISEGGRHSALASVGLKGAAIDALKKICETHKTMLDITLWKSFGGSKKLLSSTNVVGMKGMPGRRGIGVGHRDTFGEADRTDILSKWIGPELATAYTLIGGNT